MTILNYRLSEHSVLQNVKLFVGTYLDSLILEIKITYLYRDLQKTIRNISDLKLKDYH